MKKVLIITITIGVLFILLIPIYLAVVREQSEPPINVSSTPQQQYEECFESCMTASAAMRGDPQKICSVRCAEETGYQPSNSVIEDAQSAKEACELLGGIWGRFGILLVEQCSLPTTDAGKDCNDSSECEGNCFAELTDEQELAVIGGESLRIFGKCTMRLLDYFGCNAWVEGGTVTEVLCVD